MSNTDTQSTATELIAFRVKLTFTVDVDAASEEEADEMARFELLKQLLSEDITDSISADPDESAAQEAE
jgi:hypothetical protein